MWLVKLERQSLQALQSLELKLYPETVTAEQALTVCLQLGSPEGDFIHFVGLSYVVSKTSRLKQQKCILSHFWSPEGWCG